MAFADGTADTLIQVGQSISVTLESIVGRHGLTLAQWRVLDCLQDGSGKTMSSLSSACGIRLSALSRLVDRMVVRSLVMRKRDENDQRVIIVMASDFGLEYYARSAAAVDAFDAWLAERICDFELDNLNVLAIGSEDLRSNPLYMGLE
ncbi:MAG: MarR family transcriptional regulator [Rhodospirillaceae bacterium]|nr:MarR family transcriptional regulator [Rhodospirillaceae bacterium]